MSFLLLHIFIIRTITTSPNVLAISYQQQSIGYWHFLYSVV